MPRILVLLLGTLLLVGAVTVSSLLAPKAVLAANGTLQFDASLQQDPQDDADSLSWLPAGTEVFVTGGPVDGYYPVSAGVLTGWIRADALILEKETSTTSIIPGAATPVASVAVPEALPMEAAATESVLNPNAPPVSVPDPGPTGPAMVMSDVAISAGPGPGFGVLGTATVGQLVEQTGHAVSGYVTVRYIGVTGWVPLDHLGPPPAPADS